MTIRLMTSNVWGNYFGNEVEVRDVQLLGVMKKYAPDVIGMQEVTAAWQASELFKGLADEFDLVPAKDGDKQNFVPLFYRRERLELVECSYKLYHWFLDSSKGYTWAVFKDKASGKLFGVFNTHFWYKWDVADEALRCYNAKDMLAELKFIEEKYHCTAFFMGDMNCGLESQTWKMLHKLDYLDCCECADEFSPNCSWHRDPKRGADGRFHGRTTAEPNELSLDHIGVRKGTKVLKQLVIEDQDALDATDHSPVIADIVI